MRQPRDDSGAALVMSVFTAWLILMLTMVIITVAMRETTPTVGRMNETANLAAASEGIETTIGRIRSASATIATATGEHMLGSARHLPCGNIRGSTSADGASYTGLVRYYAEDPTDRTEQWRADNAKSCDEASEGASSYALIEATGGHDDWSGIADPERTVEQVYKLARFRELPGGKIRFKKRGGYQGIVDADGCMTAQKRNGEWRTTGGSITFERCIDGPDETQTWVHAANMGIVLKASIDTPKPGRALCIARPYRGFFIKLSEVTLEECSSDPNAVLPDKFTYQVTRDMQLAEVYVASGNPNYAYDYTDYCLKPIGPYSGTSPVRYGASIHSVRRGESYCGTQSIVPSDASEMAAQITYIEVEPNVGNPANAYTSLYNSYKFPGKCLNVNNGQIGQYLILWYCELNKGYEGRHNSRMEYNPVRPANWPVAVGPHDRRDQTIRLPFFTGQPDSPMAEDYAVNCLVPGVANDVKFLRCDASNDLYKWEVNGIAADWTTSNTIRNVGTGQCITATDDDMDRLKGTVRMRDCDGSDAQKWNVRYLPSDGGPERTFEQ